MKIAIIGGGVGLSRRAMMLEEEARKQGIEVTVDCSDRVRGRTITEAFLDHFGCCASSYHDSKPKQKWQGQGKRKKGRIK